MNQSTYFLFKDTVWLGGHHDGHPLVSFKDYNSLREPNSQGSRDTSPAALLQRAALWQSWMTFGFIEAVVEAKVPESLLLRPTETGDFIVCSHNIPVILRNWGERIAALRNDTSALNQWFTRVETTLMQARGMLLIEIQRPDLSPYRIAKLPRAQIAGILYMIAAIGEALTSSRQQFWLSSTQGFNWAFVLSLEGGYTQEMVKNGWCPFTCRILSGSVCMQGYASRLRPHVRAGVRQYSHDACNAKECTMNTIDTNNYSVRHTPETCQCAHSKPSLDAVVGHLSNNHIPVVTIRFTDAPDCGLSIDCHKADETPYVAISHVWADGLGSTTEDGLPECQLRRLAALAGQLIPGGAFWMDALCVPRIRDMRKKAIGLMARTYSEATVVLVIDAGILSCSLNTHPEEKLMRVLTSSWMQRLWTLQEALLARKVVFQFLDGTASIQELLPDGVDLPNNVLRSSLASEIFRLSKRFNYVEKDHGFGIGDVARSLRWRTTSRLEDETLAISSLLHVDAYELANLPPERRMMTLLLRVRNLPTNIIFLSGPKLDNPGFKWAPKTLMLREGAQLGTNEYDALCTTEGLVADYRCLCVAKFTFKRGEKCCLQHKARECFYVVTAIGMGISKADEDNYTCNGLLFSSMPSARESITVGVAVYMDASRQRNTQEGEFRPTCSYLSQAIVEYVSGEVHGSKYATRVTVISDVTIQGRMAVCVV